MTNFQLASSTWDNEELDAIQRVMESGNYSMGVEVSNFETAFSRYIGSKYCVMVNSGSSANLLMVAALFYRNEKPLKPGDEVIVPAVSWSTTYYPLYQYGLKLKFVDIDIETLNYDLESLKAAVSENTRLIMAVNLLGNPNNFTEIFNIIGDREIIVIEDNCESMGGEFDNKKTGTFGVMGSFSTYFSHHISTMEGGMIVTDDDELYQILFSLRSHGWTRGLPKENHICGELNEDVFFESFRFVLPGYNVRPLEMSGAIGISQLKKLPLFIKERRKNGIFFKELFDSTPYISIQKEIGTSSWFGLALLVNEESPFNREDLIKVLNENNIECRPIVAGNFTRNPVIKWFDYEVFGTLKNADYIHEKGLFVGNHQYDISEHIDNLYKLINNF